MIAAPLPRRAGVSPTPTHSFTRPALDFARPTLKGEGEGRGNGVPGTPRSESAACGKSPPQPRSERPSISRVHPNWQVLLGVCVAGVRVESDSPRCEPSSTVRHVTLGKPLYLCVFVRGDWEQNNIYLLRPSRGLCELRLK